MGSSMGEEKIIPVFMHSLFGEEYFLEVYAGYDQQLLHLIPDLNSSHTWFARGDCVKDCKYKNRYNLADDVYLHYLEYDEVIKGGNFPDLFEVRCNMTENYFTVKKKMGTEQILKMTGCMATYSSMKTYYADGVIALSLGSYTDKKDHNLIYRLEQHNLISNPIIGIFLDYFMGSGEMILGGYHGDYVKNDNITWLKTADPNYWCLEAARVEIGKKAKWTSAILLPDTRVSYIALPVNIFFDFNAELPCDPYNCIVDTFEYRLFPSIILYLHQGGLVYTIVPQDYVTFIPYLGNKYRVKINVIEHDRANWILGTDFLKQFYQIYDYQNLKMALYPLDNNHYNGKHR